MKPVILDSPRRCESVCSSALSMLANLLAWDGHESTSSHEQRIDAVRLWFSENDPSTLAEAEERADKLINALGR